MKTFLKHAFWITNKKKYSRMMKDETLGNNWPHTKLIKGNKNIKNIRILEIH